MEHGRPGRHLAIALVSCAVLLYEIAITRVLSVVLWYHFAFLSLSVAMLGIGAPGVWFSFRPPRPGALRLALLASSLALPGSVVALLRLKPAVEAAGLGDSGWVLVVAASMLVPMLALGCAVCILLLEAGGRRIGSLYGADLIGATAGALLVIPLLSLVATPRLVALLALLPLGALLLCRRESVAEVVAVGAVVSAALVWGAPFEVLYNKTYSEREQRPVYAEWTPTARIALFDRAIWSKRPNAPWLWGMGTRFDARPVPQMWIDQDGSAGTPIERFDGDTGSLGHLLYDVTSLGYQVAPPRTVCVIGAGGGRDVLTALTSGAATVDAVELNPGMVRAVSEHARAFSGDVYHRPGVRAVIGEGRSFLTRAPGPYDLIQISLVDSWAATSAGAYALSENFLYTVEAVQLYWSRLSEGGVVSISRWTKGPQQIEGARLALLAREALGRLGIERPEGHLAFAQAGFVGTLLVSRRPFDPALTSRLDEVCEARGFERVWPPRPEGKASAVAWVLSEGPERFTELGLDLSPPTDDRPFFFQSASLLKRQARPAVLGFNERSVGLLRSVVATLSILAATAFFVPFVLGRRLERHPEFARGSAYFAAIGLGFMAIEMPWLERSILFLGHPSYATAAVLGALLLGAGIGSISAGRLPLESILRWRAALPLTVAGAFAASVPALDAAIGLGPGARFAIVAGFLLPSGAAMGFAFPAGMMRFGDGNKAWFWAINGAFGVLAGAFSLAAAMVVGFRGTAVLGTLAYAAAALLAGRKPGRAGATRTAS